MSASNEVPEPPVGGETPVEKWESAVRARAEANGGVVDTQLGAFFDDDHRLVRLPDVLSQDAPRDTAPHDTEALLNGLIADCRFLIREVAFHSARLTPDAQHRLQFLASAKTLAVTGAKIGRTIASLRTEKTPEVPENRYRMIVEHVQTPAPQRARKGGREGGRKTP